jgi:hypothetical protein
MATTQDERIAELQRTIAKLQERLDASQAERDAALARETATAEVLQVINGSPGDLAPVFEAILEKAMRLCGAALGSFHTYHEGHFDSVAERGVPKAFSDY